MVQAEAISDAELDALVAKLDLESKVLLLSGASVFHTRAEPQIGLRSMVVSDGPAGVRGERWDEYDVSLNLPSPTAMAATWDEELIARLGGLLAVEARRKGVDVLLAPTINLQRSPVAGRHFEYFSEDPLLTARIGAAYIEGVQAGGVAATAKHYVANDSEDERLTLEARIDERTLREVYLAPFEAAVAQGVLLVMSAYNAVNGPTMSESPLLAEPLKGEWGFDGVVVSDWGAVRSTAESARVEQDLAMSGPNEYWAGPLIEAVRAGAVPEAAVDAKLRRILRLAARVGALAGYEPTLGTKAAAETTLGQAPDVETARPLLREAVAAAAVLLRNEDSFLPLDPAALRRVAVVGPNAATARLQGGGSAGVFPVSAVTPLDGIRRALAGDAEVVHAVGAHIDSRPTPLDLEHARNPRTGVAGVLARYLDADGTELLAEHRLSGRILEPHAAHGRDAIVGAASVEISARLLAEPGGQCHLAVVGVGRVVLDVDGQTLLDEVILPDSIDPATLHLTPPFRHVLVTVPDSGELNLVASRALDAGTGLAAALCADSPRAQDEAELAAAVELARSADVAIVVVGTTDETESEGFDRSDLRLPGRQDELVAAVAAANPRTVVVVNSGGPVELPWRGDVPAVLLSWFPGQEGGDGLADVLFGAAEPGGRLPTTWAAQIDDLPVRSTTPVDGVLEYSEGLHIGYRAWLKGSTTPAFWFGHGLGYTTWEYEEVSAPAQAAVGGFEVVVRVRNSGARAGREVVQVYLARAESGLDRPVRWLAGYAVVSAEPGARAEARVHIAEGVLRHWSVERHGWDVEPGAFTVQVGRSAADLPLKTVVEIGK
ncbi:MAG TPA: glycoside hydrolase family 3 C-terminal domain-containing protein [Actinocrinis sp.]|nr:glycoside hydrolase family 3 C-terminal domain-containing protein [Actinocrinis sp.]